MDSLFSLSDFKRLRSLKVSEHAKFAFLRKKGISHRIAQLLLDHRPTCHEDLMAIRELVTNHRAVLRRLVRLSPRDSMHAPIATLRRCNQEQHQEGLLSRLEVLDIRQVGECQECHRLSLCDAEGELVAIRLGSEREFVWQYLQFLGVPVPWLWMLTPDHRALLHTRLHRIPVAGLHSLVTSKLILPNGLGIQVRALAALVLALQRFTASAADRALYDSGVDPLSGARAPNPGILDDGDPDDIDATDDDRDCTEFNGCGPEIAKLADLIPEFTFGDCCNQHDLDYCEGCSECDRVKADEAFLDCMLNSAPPSQSNASLAFVYYLAVRTFGFMAFSYCFDRNGTTARLAGFFGLAAGLVTGLSALALGLGATFAFGGALTAGVGLVAILMRMLCVPCELLDDRLESVIREAKEYEERVRKQYRRRRASCARKRGWARLRCFLKNVLVILVLWLLVVVNYVIIKTVFNLIRTLVCGGLSRN